MVKEIISFGLTLVEKCITFRNLNVYKEDLGTLSSVDLCINVCIYTFV